MKLLLARHGNTFAEGDKVVMAGLSNDLPLVAKGGAQAEALAQGLQQAGILPTVVVSGALRRQKRTAEIVMEQLGIPGEPIEDVRLDELDYGPWTGLSDDEITFEFGARVHGDWHKKSIMPDGRYGFGTHARDVVQRVKNFAIDCLKNYKTDEDVILAVSSNGVLRYFLTLVEGAFEKAVAEETFKVKTGHLCGLTFKDGAWHIDFWNKNPNKI